MKKQKLFSLISNIMLGGGVIIGALALYLSLSVRASLPPGVCPIDNNRPLFYIAIGLLAGSFVLSVISDRKKKAKTQKDKGQ